MNSLEVEVQSEWNTVAKVDTEFAAALGITTVFQFTAGAERLETDES